MKANQMNLEFVQEVVNYIRTYQIPIHSWRELDTEFRIELKKPLNGHISLRKSYRLAYKIGEEQKVVRFSSWKSLRPAIDEMIAEFKQILENIKGQQKPVTINKNDSAETPAEKPAKKAEKKESKVHGKNKLGHIRNSMADLLDQLFLKGVTEKELQEHGFTPARYKSHFRHLNNDKVTLVEVRFEDGKYIAKLIG